MSIWSFTKPEAVATVHRGFLEAGADVIETDTFGGTSIVLAEYDLADRAYELNKTLRPWLKPLPRNTPPLKNPDLWRDPWGQARSCQPWAILILMP
jgi:hypothetical protein